jgi:hypothetical protein
MLFFDITETFGWRRNGALGAIDEEMRKHDEEATESQACRIYVSNSLQLETRSLAQTLCRLFFAWNVSIIKKRTKEFKSTKSKFRRQNVQKDF